MSMSSVAHLWVQKHVSMHVVAIFPILVLIMLIAFYDAMRQRRNLPPGPWLAWPILGNLLDISTRDLPHKALSALAAKFGGLMYIQMESQQEKEERENLQLLVSCIFSSSIAFVISDFVPYLSFVSKLQGVHSELEDLSKFQAMVTDRVFEVEKHMQRANNKLQLDGKEYVPDFVDILLKAPLEDMMPLTDRDIIEILMEFLVAGIESTTTTVEWAMSELILHPDVMKRTQEELDMVVGVDRLVQEFDLLNLPYLQAIVKEVFRMHPPGPLFVPRESTQATNVCGFQLPTHPLFILNIYDIQRDPSMYESPETFNPQRFVTCPNANQTSVFDSYELMPFGAGRRMRPASGLANTIVILVLAHLLHGFNWSIPTSQTTEALDMSECFGTSLVRKTPMCMVAQPRSPTMLY